LARAIAADLERAGSPVRLADLERHQAIVAAPLSLEVAGHRVFNMPPPTQGLASLMVLGIYDRLGIDEAETFEYVHGIVEASKLAFRVRDRYVGDPAYMSVDPETFLTDEYLTEKAEEIDPRRAVPWPDANPKGDTVWLGAIDSEGRAVSFIQSIYWEFGSGLVLDETGITWQNRGVSFSLDEDHHNVLRPLRRPFHTIQPAMAQLSDGRTRRPDHVVRHHGRRRPTPDPGHAVYALCSPRPGIATVRDGAALALGPHLGRGEHLAQDREPF
jgi:gamma-glutamyltranspeptidase/glutathione hydrolase